MSEFKLEYALLCDDVRREDTGRPMIIGAMTGAVLQARKFPFSTKQLQALIIGFAHGGDFEVEYRFLKKGSADPIHSSGVKLQYQGDNSEVPVPIDFEIDLGKTEFSSAGEYIFQLKWGGRRWKTVASIVVQPRSEG